MWIFVTKHKIKMIVVIAFVFQFVLGTKASSMYINTDPTLSSIPHDLDVNIKKIILNNTRIATLDFIADYPECTNFTINGSLLKEFPNVANISDTLLEIGISDSLLDEVPVNKLDSLVNANKLDVEKNNIKTFRDSSVQLKITILALTGNQIATFPHLPNLGKTLEFFKIADNLLTHVDSSDLAILIKIRKLYLGRNHLTAIPDIKSTPELELLHLNQNQIKSDKVSWDIFADRNLTVYLRSNGLSINSLQNPFRLHSSRLSDFYISLSDSNTLLCDSSAKWVYLGQKLNLLFLDDMTCDGPAVFASRNISTLTYSDLAVNQGKQCNQQCNYKQDIYSIDIKLSIELKLVYEIR